MKHIHSINNFNRQSGFSLLENMVSIVLLTVGGLGIAASTATAIKTNTDNQARAMALAAATTTLEPVYLKALDPYPTEGGAIDLQSVIKSYVAVEAAEATETEEAVEASSGVMVGSNLMPETDEKDTDDTRHFRDNFMVSILEADEADGTDVLKAAGPYVSPITVAVLAHAVSRAGLKSGHRWKPLSRNKTEQ